MTDESGKPKIQFANADADADAEKGTPPLVPPLQAEGERGLSEIGRALVAMVEKAAAGWKSFQKGELTFSEVTQTIVTLVKGAEQLIKGRNQGALKHAEVKAAFNYLDREYGLIDKLDNLIRLPFWAEPFDAMAIRAVIDLLIAQAVAALNAGGW